MKTYNKFISEKMENINFLDRIEAKKALDDGFCIVYGEKHRDLFEKIGDELINLGLKNGEKWINDSIFRKAGRVSLYFEMNKKGIYEDEKIKEIVDSLKVFFTPEEVKRLTTTNEYMNEPYAGNYVKNVGKLEKEIVDSIDEEKDITLQEPTPFYYFKQFKRSSKKQFSSVTLYGEGGLGLDEYKPKSMRYMQEENESFYGIENIALKYHYLGMLLKKQEALQYYIDLILEKMTPETNYNVKGVLRDIIYELSLESVSDKIIKDIQKKTGVVEGFKTHKQISNSLKRMSDKDLPNL